MLRSGSKGAIAVGALALAAPLLMPVGAAAQAEPAQVEPVQVEPVQVEPVQVEPVQAEPAQVDPAQPGPSASVLVMVNASSLPDIAIAASLVAAGLGDAVVFAESASALGNANADIIREQQPAQVILVGGTAALTTDLETELRGLVNDLEIERLAGMDRLHTAALAAEKVLERAASAATGAPDDPSEPTVVLANAWSLPDVGIAAAAVTGGRAEVLLYAADGWLSSPTATVLRNHRPTRLVVAGTPTTFSHQVVAEALSAADSTGPASRLDGTNTAESVALAVKSAYPDDIAIAVVASDSSLQDIGAAVALAAALDRSPVLLVHDDQLPNDANTLLLEHQPSHIVIVDTEHSTISPNR